MYHAKTLFLIFDIRNEVHAYEYRCSAYKSKFNRRKHAEITLNRNLVFFRGGHLEFHPKWRSVNILIPYQGSPLNNIIPLPEDA